MIVEYLPDYLFLSVIFALIWLPVIRISKKEKLKINRLF